MNEFPIWLIITDNAIKVAFFKKHLSNENRLLFTHFEDEAIEVVQSTPLSGIIIDESTEGIHPFALCSKIRGFSELSTLPILLITLSLKKNHTQEALEAGFTDFLNEPLDDIEVHQRIAVSSKSTDIQKKMEHLSQVMQEENKRRFSKKKIPEHDIPI